MVTPIFKMTPEELRDAVSQYKGYRWYERWRDASSHFMTEEQHRRVPSQILLVERPKEGNGLFRYDPDWSTAIADSWILVEEMEAEGYWVEILFKNGKYECCISKVGNIFRSKGDKVSIAICRTWLKQEEAKHERTRSTGIYG